MVGDLRLLIQSVAEEYSRVGLYGTRAAAPFPAPLSPLVFGRLVDPVNESATLGVLTGSHIVSVVCVHANNFLTVNLGVGRRSPAYCTAIGRLLQGALPEPELIELFRRRRPTKLTSHTVTSVPALLRIIERDRKQGWSLVSREYNDSICSIAVPVYSHTNQLMAAVSIIGTPIRTSPEKMVSTMLPRLKKTAERIWK